MEQRKKLKLGRYSLAIGLAAGFIFLSMLFTVVYDDANATDVLLTVSICASCISVFLISMEQNKKPCKKSVPNE
jgi:4-amino-4-deoxy-L-arabinose transferase-like glycosyltransferase